MTISNIRLLQESSEDGARVEALIDRAFGPGRYAKAAERLREGREPRRDLSVVAWDGEDLVGTVRLWPVRIGEAPALLLGPIAVESAWRGRGLAQAMTEEACLRAAAVGASLIVLVGEERLFAPLGFVRAEAGRVTLPGPVDAARVFLRALRPGGLAGVSGAVRPETLP